jgi:hypothetical protein
VSPVSSNTPPSFDYAPSSSSADGRINPNKRLGVAVVEGLLFAANCRLHGRNSLADTAATEAIASKKSKRPAFERKLAVSSGKAASQELFVGDGPRILSNIAALHRRPEYREAPIMLGNTESLRVKALEMVCEALKNFFNIAMSTAGSRTVENNNAVEVVLAAISDASMFDLRLGAEVGRVLGLHHKAQTRGIFARVKLDIHPFWQRAVKRAHRNQLRHKSRTIIMDWLHSDEASRLDNVRKLEITVPLCIDRGDKILYDKHWRRTYNGTWTELLAVFRKSAAWKEVQAIWPATNGRLLRWRHSRNGNVPGHKIKSRG